MIHKAWRSVKEVPYYFFKVHPSNFEVTRDKKIADFLPELSVSRLSLQFEFTDGFEVMHKA